MFYLYFVILFICLFVCFCLLEGDRSCSSITVNMPLAMKVHGGCGCKGPHFRSHGTRKRQEWLALYSAVFNPGKVLILILQQAKWALGPVSTRRSEEKSPSLRHPGSNPGRPARSEAPCCLSYLAHTYTKHFYAKRKLADSKECTSQTWSRHIPGDGDIFSRLNIAGLIVSTIFQGNVLTSHQCHLISPL